MNRPLKYLGKEVFTYFVSHNLDSWTTAVYSKSVCLRINPTFWKGFTSQIIFFVIFLKTNRSRSLPLWFKCFWSLVELVMIFWSWIFLNFWHSILKVSRAWNVHYGLYIEKSSISPYVRRRLKIMDAFKACSLRSCWIWKCLSFKNY